MLSVKICVPATAGISLLDVAALYQLNNPVSRDYDLDPQWVDETHETVMLTVPRTAHLWLEWHDSDRNNYREGVSPDLRCENWLSGESDDGPKNYEPPPLPQVEQEQS